MTTFTDFHQVINRINQVIDGVTAEALSVAEAAGGTGARMTEDLTRSRPSAKSGKRGRVESGDMAGDISFEVKRADKKMIRVDFGWLGTVPLYYIYQTDSGFIHNRSGEFIEPTFALRDATEHVSNLIQSWVRSGGGFR